MTTKLISQKTSLWLRTNNKNTGYLMIEKPTARIPTILEFQVGTKILIFSAVFLQCSENFFDDAIFQCFR